MSKIIIYNESGFPDDEVLGAVSEVILQGKISNGGYCYATVFPFGIAVYAKKNKQSDTFVVRNTVSI